MNISVSRLLDKMGDELSEAKKMSSEAKIRERAYAIKAICELILDETSVSRSTNEPTAQKQVMVSTPSLMESIKVQQVSPQQNRLKMEDGVNGESLFDF
jgi:Family of unknown function (DUF5327)